MPGQLPRKPEETRSSVPNEIKRGGNRVHNVAKTNSDGECVFCKAPTVAHCYVWPRMAACSQECGWRTCPMCSHTQDEKVYRAMAAVWASRLFRELDWDEQE